MSGNLTLCITVRFLTGTYHGRDRDGDPEWPPSPLRLFQALVAAAGLRRTEAERESLEWLEKRDAPAIVAHESRAVGSLRKHYVPNNDADRHAEHVGSRVEKAFRPLHLPDRAEVQYRWTIRDADRPHAAAVARLAGRLRCLGWGIDQVAGRGGIDCGEPDGAGRWVPDEAGGSGEVRRVPRQGTLRSLDNAHDAAAARFAGGRYRPTDANVTTRAIAYAPAGGLLQRPWLAFSLVGIADGSPVTFWPAKAAEVAGQARHAAKLAAERSGWDDATIRSFVCGHDAEGGDRLSFLPLPSVGHEHADGMIRRVLIVAPPGGEGRLQELRPRLIGPLIPEGGESTAAMVPCPREDAVVRRYVGGGKQWATVTPAVLPGHISRGSLCGEPFELHADDLAGGATTSVGRKAAKVAAGVLGDAGVPLGFVEWIVFTRVPPLPNLPHAMRFRVPGNLARHQRSHVQLVLRQRVAGPLALGIGRFRGFGTLVAQSA